MKILTSTQFKELDKYTIGHEPVSSIDLMERAAKAIAAELKAVGPPLPALSCLPVR